MYSNNLASSAKLVHKLVRIFCGDFVKVQSRCVQNAAPQYVQGQEPEPKIREYFYYIDHQGMLFLDDARMKNFTSCFKEKKFLEFFFKRLRTNTTDRYREFPYLSLCGRERNFVRCDDYPVVFTHVLRDSSSSGYLLSYGHAGDLLTVRFEPDKVIMLPDTGRVYHPAPERTGGVGLVRSKLAIEFSRHFTFDNGENNCPTHFRWGDVNYPLSNEWYHSAVNSKQFNCGQS